MQRTLEEQGVAFGSARAKEEDRIRADRRLREEQDAAYFAALTLDQVFFYIPYTRIQSLVDLLINFATNQSKDIQDRMIIFCVFS